MANNFIEYGDMIIDVATIQCAKIQHANDYRHGGCKRVKESIYAYFKNGMSLTIFSSNDESEVVAEFERLKKMLNNLS